MWHTQEEDDDEQEEEEEKKEKKNELSYSYMWCELCGVSYEVQSMWCDLWGVTYMYDIFSAAIYVVQGM